MHGQCHDVGGRVEAAVLVDEVPHAGPVGEKVLDGDLVADLRQVVAKE
jgi:hypothetical protein